MDILVFALTVVLLIALIAACLLPVAADSAEDQGDGMTEADAITRDPATVNGYSARLRAHRARAGRRPPLGRRRPPLAGRRPRLADADWPGRHDTVQDELVADGPEEDPVPTPTRPGLLLPGDD
jgi:hypothetical protein